MKQNYRYDFIKPGLEKPVIEPEMWVEMEGFKPGCDKCFLVFWKRPFDIARSILEDVVDEDKLKIPAFRGARGRYGNANICVYELYFGAPAATMAVELLIASGVKKFLVFGGCGAIHSLVKIYDVVIPTWGVREEGTSYHYLSPDIIPTPSESVVEMLKRELSSVAWNMGVRVHLGGIWTTDAMFRETLDKIRRYSERNVVCVDMESTALMSVAMYRGVELGIVLVVTDELYGVKWSFYQDDNKMSKIEDEVVRTMIKTLAKL